MNLKDYAKKGKTRQYIYSIYCPDIEDYPYQPFTAKTDTHALSKFANFCLDQKKICTNPRLHRLGEVLFNRNGSICFVQPNMYIFDIDLTSRKSQRIFHSVELIRKAVACADRLFFKLMFLLQKKKIIEVMYDESEKLNYVNECN